MSAEILELSGNAARDGRGRGMDGGRGKGGGGKGGGGKGGGGKGEGGKGGGGKGEGSKGGRGKGCPTASSRTCTIVPRHIFLGVRNDQELDSLYRGSIAEGGVLPTPKSALPSASGLDYDPASIFVCGRRADGTLVVPRGELWEWPSPKAVSDPTTVAPTALADALAAATIAAPVVTTSLASPFASAAEPAADAPLLKEKGKNEPMAAPPPAMPSSTKMPAPPPAMPSSTTGKMAAGEVHAEIDDGDHIEDGDCIDERDLAFSLSKLTKGLTGLKYEGAKYEGVLKLYPHALGASDDTSDGGDVEKDAKGPETVEGPRLPPRHKKILRDNIQGLTKSCFLRLCARAGVINISETVFEELRAITRNFLMKHMRHAITMTEHARRRTVLASDALVEWVEGGCECRDAFTRPMYGHGLYQDQLLRMAARQLPCDSSAAARVALLRVDWSAEVKQHLDDDKNASDEKAIEESTDDNDDDDHDDEAGGEAGAHGRDLDSLRTASLALVRSEQRGYTGPVFPFANFSRVVAEIGQDFGPDLTYEPRYIRVLYDRTEAYLISLLEDANLSVTHRNGLGMQPKDLRFARRLRAGDFDIFEGRGEEADKAAELRRRATALGLLQVLTTVNIADDATLNKSMAFCDEHGVTSVSDIVEYDLTDDFVRHLGLKTVPGKKLRSMLQTMLQTPTSGLAAPGLPVFGAPRV
jgi:histone H3/H4